MNNVIDRIKRRIIEIKGHGSYVAVIKPLPNCVDKEVKKEKDSEWIPCGDRMPDCEQEVEITIKEIINKENEYEEFLFTCRAFYEDGEIWSEDSNYYWEHEYENVSTYDKEKDDFKVSKGWYEQTIFGETFTKIDNDCEIIAWKPLSEPYKESSVK